MCISLSISSRISTPVLIRYGKVFKTHLLGRRLIVSTDPEVNKVVLQNQGNIFIPYYPKSITELLGQSSILQMNGTLHRRVHALIGGFFRSPQLKARVTPYIENSVKLTLSTWKKKHQYPVYVQEETKKVSLSLSCARDYTMYWILMTACITNIDGWVLFILIGLYKFEC